MWIPSLVMLVITGIWLLCAIGMYGESETWVSPTGGKLSGWIVIPVLIIGCAGSVTTMVKVSNWDMKHYMGGDYAYAEIDYTPSNHGKTSEVDLSVYASRDDLHEAIPGFGEDPRNSLTFKLDIKFERTDITGLDTGDALVTHLKFRDKSITNTLFNRAGNNVMNKEGADFLLKNMQSLADSFSENNVKYGDITIISVEMTK